MKAYITKIKLFLLTYKWLLFPIIPIIIFAYIIFYFFIAQKYTSAIPVNQQTNTQISQYPVQTNISPSQEVSSIQGQAYSLSEEVKSIASGNLRAATVETTGTNAPSDISPTIQNGYPVGDEFEDGSISQNTLPDGSIEYQYTSDDPKRTHMQIVKDGVVIFRRNLMPDDTTIDYYSSYLQTPEYTSQGSSYYGQNATIYASPKNGIAIVFDPQTKRVYEQYLFQATSLTDYIKKYGKDISAFNPAP